MQQTEVDRALRAMTLKDLRVLARARGLTPAGGKDQLEDRIKQHMQATGNFSLQMPAEGGAPMDGQYAVAPQGYQQYGQPQQPSIGVNNNNYSRPGGQQNVGNFITDRPSSHVLAPPGGKSTIQLGDYVPPAASPPPPQYQQYGAAPPGYAGGADPAGYGAAPPGYAGGGPPGYGGGGAPGQYGSPAQPHVFGSTSADVRGGALANNYSRPGGQQNVGNFITDRPSSRVLAPPGGASQISFGDYNMPAPSKYTPPPAAPAPYSNNYGAPAAPNAYVPMPGPPGAVPGAYGYGGPPPAAAAIGPDGRPITAGARSAAAAQGALANNYSRPGGQQNVGNFITDRPSSKVLAPPGGRSQITFG